MEDWTERWKTVRWDTLEQEAKSDNPTIRMHAVVQAHAVVDRAGLLDCWWKQDIRDAIEITRKRAVHYCVDPSVDEAIRAVKCFRDLWSSSIDLTTEDESSTDVSSAKDKPLSEVISDEVADIQAREAPPQHIDEEPPPQLIEVKECLCLSKAQIDKFRLYELCPIYTLAKLCGATPDLLFSIAREVGVRAETPLYCLNNEELARICGELEHFANDI